MVALGYRLGFCRGLFGRSLGDEFGAAIRGDIAKLTASYGVIIVYCAAPWPRVEHVAFECFSMLFNAFWGSGDAGKV